MQSTIEREGFLQDYVVKSGGTFGIKKHVPAVYRNCAGNEYKAMIAYKCISKCLLTRARHAGLKPARIRKISRYVNIVGSRYARACENVRYGIQNGKCLMDRDLQYSGSGVDCSVDRSDTARTPAPSR